MTAPVTCPACGAANTPADAFCGACGASLRPTTVPPLPCWNCQTPNSVGRAYCRQCGQPLAGPPTAPAGAGRTRSTGILLALLVVAVAALGLVGGFLLLGLGGDDAGGGVTDGRTARPTVPLDGTPRATREPRPTEPPATPATPTPTAPPRATLPPVPELGPPSEFVCYRSQSLDGPAASRWNLVRVHFRTGRGYDRVIYELERAGRTEDGIVPSAVARQSIPGEGEFVGAPPFDAGAESRIDVLLVNGVRDRTGLSGYQPRGMRIVESLSTQPYRSHVNYSTPEDDPFMAAVGTYSAIDVQGEGCLALRVLGWEGAGDPTAWVFVDIERP